MKVSIITICYNNEWDIRPTLESVVMQDYQDIEYLIVDGDSHDGTLAIVNEYKEKIHKIISEPDNGMYEAINKGIKYATGDIIGLIHAGDRLYSSTVIRTIVDFYQKYHADIIYGHSIIVDGTGSVKRVNRSPQYSKTLIRRGWMPSHQSIYCKRTVFEKFGYYRTDIGYINDYEWFVRCFYLHSDELKIRLIDEYIVRFSLGGQSTRDLKSKMSKRYFELVHRCWEVNGLKPPRFIVYLMFARKIKQYFLAKLN